MYSYIIDFSWHRGKYNLMKFHFMHAIINHKIICPSFARKKLFLLKDNRIFYFLQLMSLPDFCEYFVHTRLSSTTEIRQLFNIILVLITLTMISLAFLNSAVMFDILIRLYFASILKPTYIF